MTTYQVIAGGGVASEHETPEAAVSECQRLEPEYDSWAKPSVNAVTRDGSHYSAQQVYPVVSEVYAR